MTTLVLLTVAWLVVVGLGALVWLSGPGRRVNRLFALFSVNVAAWVFSNFLIVSSVSEGEAISWIKISFAITAFIPFTLLAFTAGFPRGRGLSRLDTLATACAATVVALLSLSPYLVLGAELTATGPKPAYGPGFIVFAVYFPAFLGWSFVGLWRRMRRTRGLERLQIQYVLLGTGVAGVLASLLTLIVPLAFGTTIFSGYAPVLSIVMCGFMAWSVVKHRLLDIDVVIRVGLAHTVAVGAVTTVFIILVPLLERLVRRRVEYAENAQLVISLLVVAGIAVLFQPLLLRVQALIDRWFHRQPYNYHETLRAASESLAALLTVDRLSEYLVHLVADTLQVSVSALYAREEGEAHFRLQSSYAAAGQRLMLPESLETDRSELVEALEVGRQTVLREEVDRSMPYWRGMRIAAEMARIEADAAVPVLLEDRLVAVIMCGHKLSDKVFSGQDLALLTTLANQAAGAIRKAQLYQEVVLVKEYNENVLRHMESGVITVDAQERVTTFNRAAERMIGLSATQVVGRRWRELEVDLSSVLPAGGLRGPYRANVETSLPGADDRALPIVVSTSALFDPHGNPSGTISVFSDLSRIKALEEEKARAERLASVGTLAAGLAHEIKNPLVSVKTFVELFPEKYQDIEFRETFGRVVGQEVDRIDSLVSQLLHLTRTSSPQLEQITPMEMMDAALLLVSTQCERHGITVERHYQPDLPDFLGDPPQLRQAMLNILLNAIAAMADGGTLTVSIGHVREMAPADADRVAITIADTGGGITPDHLSKIFDPFFTTKPRGTGLGLAVCHKIIQEHHGTITAQSEPGRGTAFVITLPALIAHRRRVRT
jgi:PAS domain S-box-containing protein